MNEIRVIPEDRFLEEDNVVFLLKSMEHKYLDGTVKEGRFCFNLPSIFNEWEKEDDAQYDKWDAHFAYQITRIIFGPPRDLQTGVPDFNSGKQYAANGEMHFQTAIGKHSPICCFRCIRRKDVEVINGKVYYSLGEIAKRIENEFHHDSFIILPIKPFLELFHSKGYQFLSGEVLYQDTMNDYPFLHMDWPTREIVEQLLRKDRKYEWQKEYRIVLPPTNELRVFKDIGSIKDIASWGSINELREKQCIYQFNPDTE